MSDMKCPICGQELKDQWLGQNVAHEYFNCPKCKMNGNPKLWQELIRTRKALDVAVDALKRIKFRGEHSKYECCNSSGIIAQGALEQITVLEQKE